MRKVGILVVIAFIAAALPALAQTTFDRPLPGPVPYQIDSGPVSNGTGSAQVVHEEVVFLDGAAWIRLYFGSVQLSPGSILRLTSLEDGEVQELDSAGLAMWGNTSAYFNGDTVRVELVASPQSGDNRLIIDSVAWEAAPTVFTGDCGFCGPDERVLSDVTWVSRLLPAGCTASTYNTQSCQVSAGHCIGGAMVLEYHVPLSNSNCSLNHPPIAEQFPVTSQTFTNGGIGNDWSVLLVGTNNLGEKPFERYGEFRPIATTPPVVSEPLTVWGHGVDSFCPHNQVQQTSSGTLDSVQTTSFRHTVDVTYGNSGSSVMRNGQEVLGIVTHCPCPTHATRVDHPAFASARASLCPLLATEEASLISVEVPSGWGTHLSGDLPELEDSDNVYYVVDAQEGGPRNNTMTLVTARSPFTTVSLLDASVEFGAADAQPVYVIVQIYNWDTATYKTLQLSILSPTSDSVFNFPGIPSANSYVDSTGKVELRLILTARLSQTPDGYTQRIDHVELTVAP